MDPWGTQYCIVLDASGADEISKADVNNFYSDFDIIRMPAIAFSRKVFCNDIALAWAVSPGFNPEDYYKAKPEELKNWALTDIYPPGSTMKILTVASGLEAGVIQADSHIMDTGKWGMKDYVIMNHDYATAGAPGSIDLVYLLQHSSNIASLKISLMIPPATHYKLLRGFGFGEPHPKTRPRATGS